MPSDKNSPSDLPRSRARRSDTSPDPYMLTDAEIERLRQLKRDVAAYARKAFKKRGPSDDLDAPDA